MARGWTRRDIGVRLTWRDFHNFLAWLPPTPETATWRAKRPNSWWVTPEIQMLAGILYAAEGANWQRGGGQGQAPKPIKLPTDKEISVKNAEDLSARKEAMKRRRERRG